jgi:uncharacterized repeat protein (TIGR01451 family)
MCCGKAFTFSFNDLYKLRCSNFDNPMRILLPVFLFILYAFSVKAQIQEMDTTMWGVNGSVHAIVRSGNTVYLGGFFDYVGPRTGPSAIVNALDGKLISPVLSSRNAINFSDGLILTSVADGKGGWFIGGSFTATQGDISIKHLIHILADGRLDVLWNPYPNNAVTNLTLYENTLYISGRFSYIGNESRKFLAAIDVNTGKATPWKCTPNYYVNGITIAKNAVYIRGEFDYVNNMERKGLAAINRETGEVTDWNPSIEGTVFGIATKGDSIFISGNFTKIENQPKKSLAVIDATTGQPLSWAPEINGNVGSIHISNSDLIIIGSFTQIDQNRRISLASFDASTGRLNQWNPEFDSVTISTVHMSKEYIYIGGSFKKIKGINRNYLASIDIKSGQLTDWNPHANSESIRTISTSGTNVFIGGSFSSINCIPRNSLAAIDAITGEATAWNPNPQPSIYNKGYINTLKVIDNLVYIGGYFSAIGGQPRTNLAAIDKITGLATSWSPNPNGGITVSEVYGSLLYVSGGFTTVGGKDKKYFAAINLANGQTTDWKPNLNSWATSMAVNSKAIYIGGPFNYIINGGHKYFIAALDLTTGRAFDWGPDIPWEHTGNIVNTMTMTGNTLYFGGNFTFTHDGIERKNIAAIDLTSGKPTSWKEEAGHEVYALAFHNNLLYVSSSSYLSDQYNNTFGALEITTGKLIDQAPSIGGIKTIYFWKDLLYLGSNYSSYYVFGKETITNPNYIQGRVISDTNTNCNLNIGESGLSNIIIKAEPGSFYAITDSVGNYTLAVDSGSYTVEQLLSEEKSRLIKQVCPANAYSHTVTFNSYGNTAGGTNFYNEAKLAPYLRANVASDRRRRCFTSNTTISYCNDGSQTAHDVKVHLQLPEHVVLVKASLPVTQDVHNNYVFSIGSLAAGTCATIQVTDSITCNDPNIRGLTQCTKVWITPANPTTHSPSWDGSDITLKAICLENGRVKVGIYNTGKANMADSSSYRVFLDARVVFSSWYKLNQGDSLILQVPVNGQTLRLEADQRPGHPTKLQTNISIEACGTNAQGKISLGYVAQLPQDDAEPEVAIECLPIIDSYDPNDKLVSPAGVTEHHYTPTGRALDYTIRFQNTGTDYAYRVVVVDTLSDHLDISTFKMNVTSHPYKLSVSGKGKPVLTITFDNIMLPDSNQNEPKSHGYIKFSIRPKSDLAEKIRIENFADIFFDYNEPVRTNTTINSIYDLPLPAANDARIAFCNIVEQPSISQVYREDLVCNIAADSYEWFFNGKLLPASIQTIKVTEAGMYTVRVYKKGCQSSLSKGFAYALPEPLIANYFEIYPNPNSGLITFYMQAPAGKIVEAFLYDALGRQVWNQTFISPSNNTIREEITLSPLKPGLYIIKTTVDTPRGGAEKKLIIK